MKTELWRQYPPRPVCYISANILSAAGSAFCSCISSKMLAVFCYKQLVQFKSGSPQEHPPALLRSQIESVFYVKIRFDSIQLSKSLHSCFIYHSLTCYFTQRSNFVLRPPFSHFTIQLIFVGFWNNAHREGEGSPVGKWYYQISAAVTSLHTNSGGKEHKSPQLGCNLLIGFRLAAAQETKGYPFSCLSTS